MLYAAVLSLIVLALLVVSVTRTLKLKSHVDFMVADRTLSATVLVFTLLCSWIGAGSLFGGAEFAIKQGLSLKTSMHRSAHARRKCCATSCEAER